MKPKQQANHVLDIKVASIIVDLLSILNSYYNDAKFI